MHRNNPSPAVFRRRSPRWQRGLSLVELMVGITVGLFIVAAASTLLSLQLIDNRRLMVETQIQQDLRASADIIGRELRRAGAWGNAVDSVASVWRKDLGSVPSSLAAVSPAAGSPADAVAFQSRRTIGQVNYGFRLIGGTIETRLNDFSWQALTDRTTMLVTLFRITAVNEPEETLVCQRPCADGSETCWPKVTVRSFQIEIDAESATDPSIRRSLVSQVRLRNDRLAFDPALTGACPT